MARNWGWKDRQVGYLKEQSIRNFQLEYITHTSRLTNNFYSFIHFIYSFITSVVEPLRCTCTTRVTRDKRDKKSWSSQAFQFDSLYVQAREIRRRLREQQPGVERWCKLCAARPDEWRFAEQDGWSCLHVGELRPQRTEFKYNLQHSSLFRYIGVWTRKFNLITCKYQCRHSWLEGQIGLVCCANIVFENHISLQKCAYISN